MSYLSSVQTSPFNEDYRAFLIVAHHRNISKSAEELGIGQSGLSKSIRRLEAQIRQPLFVRRNQGVELTREGLQLRRALQEAEVTWTRSLQQDSSSEIFRITLGAHSAVASAFWPSLIGKLAERLPQVHFDFVFDTSQNITRGVAKQEIDFGIVVNHVKTADLIAKPISRDYQALWRLPQCKSNRIGYNPEMMDAGKILRRFERARLISISDYYLLRELALKSVCQSILPKTLTENTELIIHGKKLR